MFNNVGGAIIAFVVGLILGAVGLWYYLRQQLAESEAQIVGLQGSLDEREQEIQTLRSRIQEHESNIAQLQAQLEEREQTIQQLEAAVHERDEQIKQMVPRGPDNLKRIEGIGPKTAAILQAAGISTFAQLASASVAQLKAILVEAGLRSLVDPSTWPEQAALAAEEKWDELAALQDQLKGGRRG